MAKHCSDRGFEFEEGKAGDRYRGHLAIIVDEIFLWPVLEERMRRVPFQMSEADLKRQRQGHYVYTQKYSYESTGELTLKIDGGYGSGLQTSWKDLKQQKIEVRLNEVIIALRALANHRLDERSKSEERQQRYQVIQRERAELRQSIAEERGAVEKLEADAGAWGRADRLRVYIAAVERQHADADSLNERSDWLEWARRQADRIDPLRTSPTSILDTPERDYQEFAIWQMRDD